MHGGIEETVAEELLANTKRIVNISGKPENTVTLAYRPILGEI